MVIKNKKINNNNIKDNILVHPHICLKIIICILCRILSSKIASWSSVPVISRLAYSDVAHGNDKIVKDDSITLEHCCWS